MIIMTFKLVKKLISRGVYKTKEEIEELKEWLDAFLVNSRITVDEYNELMILINEIEKE